VEGSGWKGFSAVLRSNNPDARSHFENSASQKKGPYFAFIYPDTSQQLDVSQPFLTPKWNPGPPVAGGSNIGNERFTRFFEIASFTETALQHISHQVSESSPTTYFYLVSSDSLNS
jgi:hypothetical protein